MKIMLSTAARTRQFSKAMRRIRPPVQAALDQIDALKLAHPTWDVVLVSISEDLTAGEIRRIANEDDCLQVMTGIESGLDLNESGDAERLGNVFASLRLVIAEAGLTPQDCLAVSNLLAPTLGDGH